MASGSPGRQIGRAITTHSARPCITSAWSHTHVCKHACMHARMATCTSTVGANVGAYVKTDQLDSPSPPAPPSPSPSCTHTGGAYMSRLFIAIQALIAGNCADCWQQPARVSVHGHRYVPTPVPPSLGHFPPTAAAPPAAAAAAASSSTLVVSLRSSRPLLNGKQVSAVLHGRAPAPFCACLY